MLVDYFSQADYNKNRHRRLINFQLKSQADAVLLDQKKSTHKVTIIHYYFLYTYSLNVIGYKGTFYQEHNKANVVHFHSLVR